MDSSWAKRPFFDETSVVQVTTASAKLVQLHLYYLDLASCNSCLFPTMKKLLEGKWFTTSCYLFCSVRKIIFFNDIKILE